jgi:UDP-2-acetamido-3-amino-2,3-dideoxy-glucuronate N-acetyltransferase
LPTAEKIAEDFGVKAQTFEGALENPEVAGVVIATPAELHAKLSIAAFAAGKHVYVEKPLALSLADGYAMKSAAETAGRSLMVGHLLQYHPAFEALLAEVRRGTLGDLRYGYSNRLSLGRFRVEENALWSFAPHDISMLLALFGDEEPETVSLSGGSFLTSGIEDETRLDLKYKDGRHAHVFCSWLHPFKEQRLVVVGTKAMAVFEDHVSGPKKLQLYKISVDTSGSVPIACRGEVEPIPYGASEPLKQECEHFLACISGDMRARTDAAEALRVLSVLTKAKHVM